MATACDDSEQNAKRGSAFAVRRAKRSFCRKNGNGRGTLDLGIVAARGRLSSVSLSINPLIERLSPT
jgi:hypothetical protein